RLSDHLDLHPFPTRRSSDLLPQAIEEGIRWEPPLTGIIRFSLCDDEVEGFAIPKGAVVNLSLASANRDETKFEHPDEFDVRRDLDRKSTRLNSSHVAISYAV